jgi:hypothetical protein
MTDPVVAEPHRPQGDYTSRLQRTLLLHPAALAEHWRELRRRRRPSQASETHIVEALGWLERAQDASPDGGIARAWGMVRIPYMGCRGWQPPYPETTGYIIPTLYEAADRYSNPRLADRATRAARWLLTLQMPSGAIPGGTVTEVPAPAAFNTGQVVLGWLAAYARVGDAVFAEAVRRACDYLAASLDERGTWPPAMAPFALGDSTMYSARAGWALAEAGVRLGVQDYIETARRHLEVVASHQHANGWIPDCCLSDPERPLLHTISYAIRGLIEGGRVLDDQRLIRAGMKGAEALRLQVRPDGWIPGRLNRDWTGAVRWSCLTGEAQMANNWMRLAAITGDRRWIEPVPRVLGFLRSVHDVTGTNPGLRGGVRGSWPLNGGYAPYEVLAWATKFFCDALMRWSDLERGVATPPDSPLALA